MNDQGLRKTLAIEFAGRQLVLRHDGSAYLPETRTLLVADLHLGKEASFRSQSIPVPDGPTGTTLSLLTDSLCELNPDRLLILGDMIHDANSLNSRLRDEVTAWRQRHEQVDVVLVRGNHDRHVQRFPTKWNMQEVDYERFVDAADVPAGDSDDSLPGRVEQGSEPEVAAWNSASSLFLVHQAVEDHERGSLQLASSVQTLSEREQGDEHYFVEGHWHPVVKIGVGADRVRVRCFCIRGRTLTLPAFGPFKGGHPISLRSSIVYPIVEGYLLAPPT